MSVGTVLSSGSDQFTRREAMSEGIKIVTIGGGSSYTPELMEGFIKRYDENPIREICLVDVEEGKEKLSIVAAYAQRMWDATKYKVKITHTLKRREALPDADFVTTQFRVGQLEARIKDERIPSLHGMLGQETNGAGGILKALRTIPVIGKIIQDMRELCPNAWLINFTNPSGMITEAAIKHFNWPRTIGLCNVPEIAEMLEPNKLAMRREDLVYHFAGLNHFHWHKIFDHNGIERTADVRANFNEKDGGTPVNIYLAKVPEALLTSSALVPCGYHRYYYAEDTMLEHSLEAFQTEGTRAEQMYEIERQLFQQYADPALNYKPEALAKRGGAYYSDAACKCISAINNNKEVRMAVSTSNKGAITCLPHDSIVEISSLISARGAEPLAWGEMPSFERGWLQMMKAMEECTIDAALRGDYGLALQAFTLNPLVKSGNVAKTVLDELLVAHEKHLPQFSEKINELKKQGVGSTDPVLSRLMQ